MTQLTESSPASGWRPTACILCECNCGIEVRLGGDGRGFERIRGDMAHPASQGYTCEKALRLDHYQNGLHRLTTPLRRGTDGTYEPVDWDTAIAEVAAGFARVRDTYGGGSIFYYGGGGQGNHLDGAYAAATRAALGVRYKSNALEQEKTGEAWVNARVVGAYNRGDIEHAEVAVFVGKIEANGGGALVNILSVLSWVSMPATAMYSASKAAAWSVTNSLRVELAPRGIVVVGVLCGFLDTDMAASIDAPKLPPGSVVEQVLSALRDGRPEVLADDITARVRAGLSGDLAGLYPSLVTS